MINPLSVRNSRSRLLLALPLTLLALALFASRADAWRAGWDWGSGRVGGPHAWVVLSDAELIRGTVRQAASAACSRAIRVPFSGSPCADRVDRMLATVDWRGFNNRGVFAEASIWPRRTFIGRW